MFLRITNMLGALAKQEDDRHAQLLKLYWNRAGVKRELKSLKEERFALLDKLKDQEDEIIRAKEQLDGLERLLVNPMAAANAMVYFQLRHLWRIASQRLERYSAELELQKAKRERAKLQDAATAKRNRRLEAIENNIATLRERRQLAAKEAARLEEKLTRMNSLIRLIRGPRTRADIKQCVDNKLELDERIEEMQNLAEKIRGEPLPEPESLSVESRRIINTATIALAQQLAMHFSARNLASLALAATQRSVRDMKFGDRQECDRMVESIRERIADLDDEKAMAELVKQRASKLSRELSYRNETDTVPSTFSTPSIAPNPGASNKSRRSSDVPLRINVLADDYWNLSSYLR
jgi:hypothetical protein